MQCDEIIWSTINHHFCSYKVKTLTSNFCRHEQNVTGLCNRQSCPLANSNYATVINKEGKLFLYIKTIERAHSPAKMWEKIKLSKNYQTALDQISKNLEHWPKFLIHKCKQRLTKMQQTLSRTRTLTLKTQPKLIAVNSKLDKREARREQKAEKAAKLERTIENELLDRLRKGVYSSDGIVNEQQASFLKALDVIEELEEQVEYEEEEEEEDLDHEFVSDLSDDDFDDIEQGVSTMNDSDYSMNSDDDSKTISKKKKKSGPHVQIEYEEETERNLLF